MQFICQLLVSVLSTMSTHRTPKQIATESVFRGDRRGERSNASGASGRRFTTLSAEKTPSNAGAVNDDDDEEDSDILQSVGELHRHRTTRRGIGRSKRKEVDFAKDALR